MTNATADPRRANQRQPQPPPVEPAADQSPLDKAPEDVGPPAHAAPLNYRAEFLIETEEGFHVLIVGEQLKPADVSVWVKNTSAALVKSGFKPVRRDVQINIETPAPPAIGQAASGAAEWIKGANGGPPSCSLHGPAKWVTGNYKPDHAKAGQSFAFWACQTRNCRPKGEPT